jgi:hypothetical protein
MEWYFYLVLLMVIIIPDLIQPYIIGVKVRFQDFDEDLLQGKGAGKYNVRDLPGDPQPSPFIF